MTNLHDHQYITTFTGRRFSYLDPAAHDFSIEDVAHSLSLTARFRGHTVRMYTVAQHSLLVSRLMRQAGYGPNGCLAGLLHDGHEAYFGDPPSPLKWAFPNVARAENKVRDAFRGSRLCELAAGYWGATKSSDLAALHIEAGQLFACRPAWVEQVDGELLGCPTAEELEEQFLSVYDELRSACL